MALVFTKIEPLAHALNASFPKAAIVGVDGWTGVGKTTLANALAGELNGSTYDLDDALILDRKSYVPALQLDQIADALARPNGFLFVSGICLRQVLEQVGCEASAHVYVKRMATWGWADEDELEGGSLSEIRRSNGGEATRLEMRLYHAKWQPHLKADYEFHRFE